MISQFVDGLVGVFSPKLALERALCRNAIDKVRSLQGGTLDRRTAGWKASPESGEIADLANVQRARWRAWDLYQNSVYARKIVHALIAQIVGLGLTPESMAVKRAAEGSLVPDQDFRNLSKELWDAWCHAPSILGAPGYGGLTFAGVSRVVLREVILSGEILIRLKERPIARPNRALPFEIELISCERLIEDNVGASTPLAHDHFIYRGIEFNGEGERVAYHLSRYHPQDPRLIPRDYEPIVVPADEILHIYVPEKNDSFRGVTWFAPAVLQMRNLEDYQENELTAAAVGACVVAGITRPGGSGTLGLEGQPPNDNVDRNDNRITRMQPGMFFDLQPGEKIEGFNPQRPNGDAEAFIALLLRSLAGALPGLKASTVTMDYRASSFSSERSADNDCWRETEQVQQWFVDCFCQPLWDRVQESGVANGWFSEMDLRSFSEDRFHMNRRRYLAADWEGPIAKSINPIDDVTAAEKRIENNLSSPQAECRNIGTNLKENLAQKAEYYAELKAKSLPNKELLAAETEQAKAEAASQPPDPAAANSKRNRWVGPNGEDLSKRIVG